MANIAKLAPATNGSSFSSLPLELRNMVYKNLLVAAHPLECRYPGTFGATRREDMHVVDNLKLLKLGVLPALHFTLEARYIFVRHNSFQIDQYELKDYFCSWRLDRRWSVNFSPRIWIRHLRVQIIFEQLNGARVDNIVLSGALRQLLQLPNLETVDVVFRTPLGKRHDNAANTLVVKSAKACMELQCKLGDGLKLYLERYTSSKGKKVLYERRALLAWGAWHNEVHADEDLTWLLHQVCMLTQKSMTAVRRLLETDSPNARVPAESVGGATSAVLRDITWIWNKPSQDKETSLVAKGKGTWFETVNGALFHRNPRITRASSMTSRR